MPFLRKSKPVLRNSIQLYEEIQETSWFLLSVRGDTQEIR
eukprot:gene19053-915_t